MARLPNPGSDSGDWGTILNGFLSVSHNANGTIKGSALPPAPTGSGHYIGVNGGPVTVADNDFVTVPWSAITASNGTSLVWDSGNSTQVVVAVAGVYAMDIQIAWQDDGIAGSREVELFMDCGFNITDQAPATNVSGQPTYQTLHFTAYLQPSHNIRAFISQNSGGPIDAYVKMLVTRCA
jgi:hypothetical protein